MFIQTPLFHIAEFLTEGHRVPVRVAEPHREVPLTLNLKGVPLEQTLDVICLKLGLSWDTDGKSIVIENEPSRLLVTFEATTERMPLGESAPVPFSAPPPFRPLSASRDKLVPSIGPVGYRPPADSRSVRGVAVELRDLDNAATLPSGRLYCVRCLVRIVRRCHDPRTERYGSEGGDDLTQPHRWTQTPLFCIRWFVAGIRTVRRPPPLAMCRA